MHDEVVVGQVYAEKDKRFPTRRIRLLEMKRHVVICESWYVDRAMPSRRTRIAIHRLRSDYRLLPEEPIDLDT